MNRRSHQLQPPNFTRSRRYDQRRNSEQKKPRNHPTYGADDHVRQIKAQTSKPYAINLIVNKANPRVEQDLEVCVKEKVPLVITSLGNPQKVIEAVHTYGGKVFCDVTDLKYALKVQDQGCD